MLNNTSVSNLSLFFMILAAIMQLLFPIALALYFYRKERISIKVLFIGILSFTVTQILVRMPLLRMMETKAWFQGFASTNAFLLHLILAASAGIFEEFGRVYGFQWFLKDRMEWKDGIAFGIGHGGIESIYIGLSSINNIVMSLAINSGTFESLVGNKLSPEMAVSIKEQLISLTPTTFLAGGFERIFTLFIQIGLTLLALYGIKNHQHRFSIYAILIHTLIDLPLPYLLGTVGLWGTEAFIAIIGIIALVLILKARKWFEPSKGVTTLGYDHITL